MTLLQLGVVTPAPLDPGDLRRAAEPAPGWLTELLEDRGLSEALAEFLAAGAGRGAKAVLIVVIAFVAHRLAQRLITRAVTEMKEPRERSGPSSLQRRFGLVNEGRTPSTTVRRAQRADSLAALGGSVATVVIWATAVLMILGTFGISLAPLVASAGIIGIAVGFGAQDLVRDFLSGVFMLLEDQYGVGDIIDVGEATGVVEGISLRSTELRSIDGTLWHVPNGEIRRVGNKSQEFSRVVLDVAVAYDTDVERASQVILAAARELCEDEEWAEWVLAEPELWGVEELAESAMLIRLVVKVAPGEQWQLARDLRRTIRADLADAGVEIPFPQRTVWMRTDAGDEDPPGPPQATAG